MAEALPVKDKKVEVRESAEDHDEERQAAIQGTCPERGGKVFKIGG